MKIKIIQCLFLSSLFFLGMSCSNSDTTQSTSKTNVTVDNEAQLQAQDTIKITLNSNDRMQFDLSEIVVWAGQIVHLTLNHTGTLPLESMGNNFVLIDNAISVNDFAKKTVNEKENQYLPKDKSNVIAHTDLIGGGQSTEAIFAAPAVGTYDYLCSFPGHASIMKGKLIVKAKN